jgi:hypothetical protein
MGLIQQIAPSPATALEAGIGLARKIAACGPLGIKTTLESAHLAIDESEAAAYAFGMTDLVVALTLGAVTAYQLIHVIPSGVPISELPLAVVPTVGVPLLFAVHITSVSALARARRTPQPATAPPSANAPGGQDSTTRRTSPSSSAPAPASPPAHSRHELVSPASRRPRLRA